MLVHVVVLLAFAIGGSLATIVTIQRRMIK